MHLIQNLIILELMTVMKANTRFDKFGKGQNSREKVLTLKMFEEKNFGHLSLKERMAVYVLVNL